MVSRIIEKHTPQKEYPSAKIACYCTYRCEYCMRRFYLVNPDTLTTGGVIQKEILARDIETREISKVGRMSPVCVVCIREALGGRKMNAFLSVVSLVS